MRVRRVLAVVFILSLIQACKPTLTDDQIRDRIIGNWESALIVQGSLNFTPKSDSAVFYTEGKKNFISFSKRGIASKTGLKANQISYFVEDGFLMTTVIGSTDTLTQEIIFLNSKKLVLLKEEVDQKFYYSRFVY